MQNLEMRHSMSAAAAGSPAAAAVPLPATSVPNCARALSPAALKVAAEPAHSAYSPIVLAGTVRLVELGLIMLVGFAVYAAYVVPIEGFEWHYLAAIGGIGLLAMLAFQAADIYQVQ